MTARVQIVFNPSSGSFSRVRLDALAAAWADAGFSPILSESSAAVTYVPDMFAAHICVAGGDGTLRHVYTRLATEAVLPPLSVYPMGTINLVARELGMPRDAKAFVRKTVSAPASPFIPGYINGSLFMACASIGPDSFAVANVSERIKRRLGRLAYGMALFRLLGRWQRLRLTVSANGLIHTGEALYIAKGRYFAGPWSFAPHADVSDERLHIIILKTARRRDFLAFSWAMVTGQTAKMKGVYQFSCTALEWVSDRPCPIQTDGDLAYTGTTGKVSTKRAPCPGALSTVISPPIARAS
jgi:diacylglycerol kinase (ATP)